MHSEIEKENVENEVETEEDDLGVDDHADTVVMSEDSFSDPDISMEVNVEKLVAELDKADDSEAQRKAEIRHRLEELAEEGSFEDTYAIDLSDD